MKYTYSLVPDQYSNMNEEMNETEMMNMPVLNYNVIGMTFIVKLISYYFDNM